MGCLCVIHGYGSSGRGGVIREKVRQWLHAQARNGTVKAVINGEDFDIFNISDKTIINVLTNLVKDGYLERRGAGRATYYMRNN